MRRAILALALVLFGFSSVGLESARAADAPAVTGVYLVAPYPSVTVAGGTTSISLKLRNYGEAPEPLALSVTGLPDGWRAQFLGGGQPVGAAMAATNDSSDLTLSLTIPASDTTGTTNLVVHADGATQKAELPLQVTLGGNLPVNLSLTPVLPSLRGTPSASFSYDLTIANNSGRDLLVSLSSTGPKGFTTSFTQQYETQEVSSLPVKAGTTQVVTMKVTLPNNVKAGHYTLDPQITGGGATAGTEVSMDISGQDTLSLSTPDGLLSGSAEAGQATQVTFVVTNTGTAAASNVSFSASNPDNWKVDFDPANIDTLNPGDKKNVVATITPTAKAIAGDYVTTMTASAGSDTSSADYRVTVTTSTIWGVVGVGLVAIALLALLGAVARFGRR